MYVLPSPVGVVNSRCRPRYCYIGYTGGMPAKKLLKQPKLPKTSATFEQAIKALANTPPISNKELVKRNQKK